MTCHGSTIGLGSASGFRASGCLCPNRACQGLPWTPLLVQSTPGNSRKLRYHVEMKPERYQPPARYSWQGTQVSLLALLAKCITLIQNLGHRPLHAMMTEPCGIPVSISPRPPRPPPPPPAHPAHPAHPAPPPPPPVFTPSPLPPRVSSLRCEV